EAISLNGYSQGGASANTLAQGSDAALKIVLSGASNAFSFGLRFTNSGNIVRGLSIVQFQQAGLEINGDSNRVEGCFIGLDPVGAPLPNYIGVHIAPQNPFGNATGGNTNVMGE